MLSPDWAPSRAIALATKLAATAASRWANLGLLRPRGMLTLAALFVGAPLAIVPAQGASAFPGAEGHGKSTQGGRDGRIILVTNLADSGPGSFRACAEATGRRNCVFRVGGVIRLRTPVGITAGKGNLSILGQTAPGEGILLTIGPNTRSVIKTPLYIKDTADVLIRHIRVRPLYPSVVPNADAITVENSTRIYLDHVSGSWATDENLNLHGNTTDITIAYSIFAEGLARHSKCALLGSSPRIPQKITFWRNVCASNNDRNPDTNHFGGSCVEIINNIFYNARSEWAEIFSQFSGGTPVSYVSNYFKAGPSTHKSTFAITWNKTAAMVRPRIYQAGNVAWAPPDKNIDLIGLSAVDSLVSNPPCVLSATDLGIMADVYQHVRSRVGAFPRDLVDQRVLLELGDLNKRGSGSIKKEAGVLTLTTHGNLPYADADGDGMADGVESRFGSIAGLNDPWTDGDFDDWSNFDEFMQWLSEERIAGRYPN